AIDTDVGKAADWVDHHALSREGEGIDERQVRQAYLHQFVRVGRREVGKAAGRVDGGGKDESCPDREGSDTREVREAHLHYLAVIRHKVGKAAGRVDDGCEKVYAPGI